MQAVGMTEQNLYQSIYLDHRLGLPGPHAVHKDNNKSHFIELSLDNCLYQFSREQTYLCMCIKQIHVLLC